MRDGRRSVLRAGESAQIEPGVWHDWWNEAERKAVVRVEFTPGERFVHMIETMFGLAREGHVNAKGMPSPLQLALTAQEFSDVIVFRKPPPRVQRVLFGALTPIARRRGYRATYRASRVQRWRRGHLTQHPTNHQISKRRRRGDNRQSLQERATAALREEQKHTAPRGSFPRGAICGSVSGVR